MSSQFKLNDPIYTKWVYLKKKNRSFYNLSPMQFIYVHSTSDIFTWNYIYDIYNVEDICTLLLCGLTDCMTRLGL